MYDDNDDESFYTACDSSSSFHSDDFDTLGTLVAREFQNNSNYFNVCHINAQSIPSHYSDFIDCFSRCNVHAILVSETWLKPILSSTSYSLPGYVLLRNDRTGKGGGGVAIYLRSDYAYRVLSSSPSDYSHSMEHLFIEAKVRGVKVFLGVIYCPPTVDYFSTFEHLLTSYGSEYMHHIIMGDFNTDLLRETPRSRSLRYITESADFTILPLQPTHHNADASDSWLDLILVTSNDHVIKAGQLLAPGFSRHDLIYLTYKIKTPKLEPVVVNSRSFSRLDMTKLRQDASSIDWAPVFASSTVDVKVSLFSEAVLRLFNRHAPMRPVRLRRPPAPWITEGVRLAMVRRDKAFRKYKQDRSVERWNVYKTARNFCNQVVRAAKRRYIHANVISASSADTWKFLKSLGLSKPKVETSNMPFSLNELNNHFSRSSPLNPVVKLETISLVASLPSPSTAHFTINPVSKDDIIKIISSINSSAIGHDELGREMLLLILNSAVDVITHIINYSIFTGVFPSSWRKAFVIPLPKINNPCSLSHFRPISILPFLSKVLEAVVHKQLSSYVFTNSLLSPFQSGFRSGHSTTTALLKVVEDIRQGMELSQFTILVLIDFSNAFNAVDHDLLLATLTYLGSSQKSSEWFSSYLRDRHQAIRKDHLVSDWCTLDAGVPQGGILSPLLFSLFINLITSKLRCSYHLYADDLQIYTQASLDDLNTAIALINDDLNYINDWSSRFGISVNPSKCQAIIVGSKRRLVQLKSDSIAPISFNGVCIPLSDWVRNLGICVDSSLSWNVHLAEVSRKVTNTLRALYRFKHFLPVGTKKLLVQALVLPVIDYGDACFTNFSQDALNKLERLINNGIRFIFGLRKYDHISPYRRQLNWLPIRQRRSLRVLCTLYSILFEQHTPQYLKCKFSFICPRPGCQLRTSRSLSLSTPAFHTDFMSNSFALQAIRLWNSLPLKIRQAPSKHAFKGMLRKHLLSQDKDT